MMSCLSDILRRFTLCTAGIGREFAAYGIILMTAIVAIGTIVRAIPGAHPFNFVEEYAGYLFVVVAFMGLGDTFLDGAHVRVSLLTRWLTGKTAIILEIVVTIVAIVILSILLYFAWSLLEAGFISGEKAQSMTQTPIWIPRLFMVPGYIIFILQMVHHLIKTSNYCLNHQ